MLYLSFLDSVKDSVLYSGIFLILMHLSSIIHTLKSSHAYTQNLCHIQFTIQQLLE